MLTSEWLSSSLLQEHQSINISAGLSADKEYSFISIILVESNFHFRIFVLKQL